MSGGYIILVGNEHPSHAIIATPDKKTGQPMPGTEMDHFQRVGSHLVLNRARVWGRRIIKNEDGKITKSKGVEFNTPEYKGELEFMAWGKDGGYAIDVRYIPQSRSLDFEYQQNVQRIAVNPDQELVHIILKAGENKFDYKKDALLIQFLQIAPANRDSKSKNTDPQIKGYVYYEQNSESLDKRELQEMESSTNAGNLVMALSENKGKIRNLFTAMGKRDEFGRVNYLDNDGTIYKTLLRFARSYPVDFFQLIKSFKEGIQETFDKAKSYDVLDLTKDGFIAILEKGKPRIVFEGVEGKGEKMIECVVDNYLEEEVFKSTEVLKKLVSELK